MITIAFEYAEEFVTPSEVHESLFVGNLWKNPNLYSKYKSHKIEKSTFTKQIWYFYYRVGKEMYESGMRSFEDTSVYSFLISRPKEKNKPTYFESYDGFGGFDTIQEVMNECVGEKANDEYHLTEIQKYESLRNLQKENIINVQNKAHVKKLVKMPLRQLQTYFGYQVKNAFSHINSGDLVIYNLLEDIEEVVDELDLGEEMGMPFYEAPRLNRKINGMKNGNLIYLVLSSGVGKSSFITEKGVMSAIVNEEKMLIFVNEEGKKRWQARLLTTVASRILNKAVPRDVVTRGKYTDEVKGKLKEAAAWLKQYRPDYFKLIVLKKYRIEDVINNIELHRPLGYSKILFDTFKPDMSSASENRWLSFSNSAQELYDCIKEENYNCATLATVQMKIGKEFRYIDLDSIGKSMEIVEVAAVVLAGRMLYDDEFEGKNKVYCYNHKLNEFEHKWEKEEYHLDPKKKYLILFLPKNREGSEDEQIVFEVIPDFNIWKEVAYAKVRNLGLNK